MSHSRRALWTTALVLLVLGGTLWWVLHAARIRVDQRLAATCTAAVGHGLATTDAAFAAEGLDRHDDGATVTHTTLTSSWQSFACILTVSPAGVVTRADVFRMTRQETWGVYGGLATTLARWSIPLTP